MNGYTYETFRPHIDPVTGDPDEPTSNYIRAMRAGFHDANPSPRILRTQARQSVLDKRVFTAVYQESSAPYGYPPAIPVATFAHFTKDMNVGLGHMLPVHLITWVTVRPSHRRRGILRSLMTENLLEARRQGFCIAALTATEGGIYTRFGFGAATWYSRITVDTSPGFALLHDTDRRVEMCDPEVLETLSPQLYEQFMRVSPGAIGRQQRYIDVNTGTYNQDTGEPDKNVRAALHYDSAGDPDGYVTYRFDGWDKEPRSITVLDFVAVTDDAYAALWEFLGSIDLVEQVNFGYAAEHSPLAWLLRDPRRAKVTGQSDGIWLRILDPLEALRARPWTVPGRLSLCVSDDHDIASGCYLIDSTGTGADVQRLPDNTQCDLYVNVAELGSIYLGGADPVLLTRAGRIREETRGASLLARALFGLERRPYSPNDF